MRRARISLGAFCLLAAVVRGAPPAATPAPLPEIPAALEKSSAREYTVPRDTSCNEEIAEIVRGMPKNGGYSSSSKASAALSSAIALDPAGRLLLRPEVAKPAYCSGATYLVFLTAIDHLQRDGRLSLSQDALKALLMRQQPDGTGIWGRWNANGPGTACLFHDLRLGRNFTSIDAAQPGDFAKFWWSEEVGSREHGHSVIFMGTSTEKGVPMVTFWSANIPEGFSTKTIPRGQIRRALFSRLEHPQALEVSPQLEPKDPYLADMLKRASTDEELQEKTGLLHGETGLLQVPVAKAVPLRKPVAATTPLATPAATPKKRLF